MWLIILNNLHACTMGNGSLNKSIPAPFLRLVRYLVLMPGGRLPWYFLELKWHSRILEQNRKLIASWLLSQISSEMWMDPTLVFSLTQNALQELRAPESKAWLWHLDRQTCLHPCCLPLGVTALLWGPLNWCSQVLAGSSLPSFVSSLGNYLFFGEQGRKVCAFWALVIPSGFRFHSELEERTNSSGVYFQFLMQMP